MAEQAIPVQSGYEQHRPKTERRAWVRVLRDPPMAASITNAQVIGWLGLVRDISRGGIALILRRRFKRGTKLILDLASKAGELRHIPAQVAHAKREADGRWIIGCEFTSPLSQEEIQSLLWE